VRWYNVEHRHSGIRYVTPEQRHAGEDTAILAARHALYVQARERNPARWSATPATGRHRCVTLNPERDAVVSAAADGPHTQQMAA
jgi:putative transposase